MRMDLKLGLHGAVIPQADLITGLKAAAQAGFSAYEPEVARLIENSDQRRQAGRICEELKLTWLPLNEIEAFTQEPAHSSEEVLSLAAELSIPAVTVIPQAGPRDIRKAEAATALAELAKKTSEKGVSAFFEMLGFQNRAFHTVVETLDLVQTAGVRLVLDTFHFVICGASPEQIARIPKELIGVVHISDAQTEGKSLVDITDAERVLPGEGGLPLVEVLDAIRQTGYEGDLSVEVFHPKYKQRDPFQVALEAYERTSSALKKSGWCY